MQTAGMFLCSAHVYEVACCEVEGSGALKTEICKQQVLGGVGGLPH